MARKSRFGKIISFESESNKLYKAGIYCRLSVEDGDSIDDHSIGNQQKIICDFLKSYTDILIVDKYIDNGFSGMNYQRPGFQKMFNDLVKGKINCIIVKDISRLGRHYIMTSDYVERIFPKLETRLICINDDFDSLNSPSDRESLLLPFKMIMNDAYAKDISKKIKSSIQAKINNNEFLPASGSIPYGYIRNSEKNTFDVDVEAALVINRIYRMRANGMKYNAIATILNQEEISCPLKLRFNRGMTRDARAEKATWIRKTIRTILSDQVYLGHRIHGKYGKEALNDKKTKRSEEELIVIKHAHTAIVSKELFEAVQINNEQELKRLQGYNKRPDAEYDFRGILRGKVFCGDCLNGMIAIKGLQRTASKLPARIYYECSNYKRPGSKECCSHYIRQEKIMEAVQNFLDKQMNIAVNIEQMLLEIQENPEFIRNQRATKDKLVSLNMRCRNLESKQEQLLMDLTEGTISKEEYEYIKQKYSKEYVVLTQEDAELKAGNNKLTDALNLAKNWIADIKEYKKIPEINKDIFDKLIKQVFFYKEKKIIISPNFRDPYKPIFSYINECSEERVDAYAG